METVPWHDDDFFWELLYRRLFAPPKRWEAAATEIAAAVQLLDLPAGSAILDLCCGPGRHSLELARRGYRVTGVDRTERYIQEARERAAAEQLEVEFVHEDMRRFRREGAFDAALNIFTSFGYFEDPEENRRVLEHLAASVRPGGKLLMETMGKEILARIFSPRHWERQGDVISLSEITVDRDWSFIRNHVTYLVGDERHEFDMNHYVYSGAELKGMLQEAGFPQAVCYGSLEGAPYDNAAQRLVVVATR